MNARTLEALIAQHGHGPSVVSYCPVCGTDGRRTLRRCGESVLAVGPYPHAGSMCLKHAALAAQTAGVAR